MLTVPPEMPVYPLLPISLCSGKGAYVYDESGTEYLDMYGGHAVAAIGHCHPRLTAAVALQARTLFFYSNVVDIAVRRRLCERLAALGPPGTRAVFLCNSGAEANENALTLARLLTRRKTIVSVAGGFHGRTLLTLSLSGIDKYRKLAAVGGEPLFQHARRIPMGDVDAATGAIDEDCAAAIVEPVQGLAGCVPAPVDFLASMRRRCDDVGAVLIFDEVQCGTGRTGAFTAAQAFGVWPHVVTLAKGLAGGFPIGAVLADERTTGAAGKGDLGSTFGGGPLACAAALATLDVLESEGLLDNARTMGGRLFAALRGLPGVVRVQGAGLMVGIVLDRPAAAVRDALLARHRIIVGTSDDPTVLRLLPPLSLSAAQADDFVRALGSVLQ